MSEKFYSPHTTGVDDDVLITMAMHHVSFSVQYWDGKVHVDFGPHCGVQLPVEKAQALRSLLDAGIADALQAQALAARRVDLVKAAA